MQRENVTIELAKLNNFIFFRWSLNATLRAISTPWATYTPTSLAAGLHLQPQHLNLDLLISPDLHVLVSQSRPLLDRQQLKGSQ